MGILDDVGDAIADVPLTTPDELEDPETGETRPLTGGTLPFGPAAGSITKVPKTLRAAGAVSGDYLTKFGPVGQVTREADLGPGGSDGLRVSEAVEVGDAITGLDANDIAFPDPDETDTARKARWAIYLVIVAAALWLLRPILEIGANLSE